MEITNLASEQPTLAADGNGMTRREGHINALQNGLAVFDMFEAEHPTVTVAEIARRLDMHKSTASRIAATLVAAGFLRPAMVGTGFQLSGKLTRLGSIAATDTNFSNVATPFLRSFVQELGETCHVGVLEGREAVTVALVEGSYAVRLNSFVGKRSAAHCTAMGKVLLAQMPESNLDLLYPKEELPGRTSRSVTTKTELLKQLTIIRKHGFAIDDEELEPGLRCVAAPIRDHEDQVIASLTMAGASSRMPVAMIGEYSERVIHYAGLISRALGATDQAA